MDSASFPANHARSLQLFRKRLSDKMGTRQSRKAIWDMIITRFLTPQLWNLYLLLSFNTGRRTSMASRAILSNFVEAQWTQNHLQYLSGLSQALFQRSVLEKALCKSNTRLVILLEYPHSLTATFCFPQLFQLIKHHYVFFQSKPWTPPPPPWGESSGGGKRKGDQFYNCLHTKVSV